MYALYTYSRAVLFLGSVKFSIGSVIPVVMCTDNNNKKIRNIFYSSDLFYDMTFLSYTLPPQSLAKK